MELSSEATPDGSAIEPDTKDWTWVIAQGCPECGWRPPEPTAVAGRVEASIARWVAVLSRPDAAVRSDPSKWAALEYGCHVRDVCVVFGSRLEQMLLNDNPSFANWDQDEAARADGYHEQDPSVVAAEYTEAAQHTASLFAAVTEDQWPRPGTRSNGSEFTVATLAVYFLHDLEHHLHDVNG